MDCYQTPYRPWTGSRRLCSAREGERVRFARALRLVIPTALLLATGCNLLLPAAFVGDHRKKVLAEFDKLPRTRTAVLVWARAETRFDYPQIQFELSSYITEMLGAKLNEGESRLDLVDPRDIADFLQREPSAANSPSKVGKQFNADYVVFVELSRFQIRDADSPQLLRPRVEAAVSVHDIRANPDRTSRYELTPVTTTYDDGRPVLLTGTNAQGVRVETYRIFAEQVARKFYDHTVDL